MNHSIVSPSNALKEGFFLFLKIHSPTLVWTMDLHHTNLTLLLLTEKRVFKLCSKGRLLCLTNSLCYKLYNSHPGRDYLKCHPK